MPFDRPTLAQLIDAGSAEFEGRLPGVLAQSRRSVVGVLNRMLAGALDALYKYADWLFRQAWPDVADAEYLDGHGARWGVTRNPASAATVQVLFTGTMGTLVPLGTEIMRADGWRYTTTTAVTLVDGEAAASALAVTAGQAGNVATGERLTLTSPVAGVAAVVTATATSSGGTDAELDGPYRARILARIRKPPQGGALDDYIEWAKSVSGITRVWVYPGEQGASSVVVRVMRDDDPNPFPDSAAIATVQAAIDAVRPVTAAAIVVAPVAAPLPLTIQLTPNTTAVRAAVAEELDQLILQEGVPGGTILISHLREVISAAAGESDHVLVSPTGNVTFSAGQLPVLGVITWA